MLHVVVFKGAAEIFSDEETFTLDETHGHALNWHETENEKPPFLRTQEGACETIIFICVSTLEKFF